MSSSSKKGKSGGKKLSADKQLLVLQDVLTSGVSELQLAAQRLGDHQITMLTGTNQEKRGVKEAYVKVKVEVAALEVEVEELKDVLWVLKASKADKEALEGGDINSILFASAGSGGGGSGGGTGLSKSSSSGVDSGGNCEVTFKSKARLKSVPKLDVETSTSVWEVINFISNFEIKMRSHKVSKGDQKIYLLGDGGGCSLLTELCGIVRGTGSGVRQATRKFLQEKLDKVWPATAEERKEILSLTHAKSHMGENMLFNMIWEDGYWWETLWKECKKLTCSCKECMFFNIGRKGFHLVSTI